MLDRLFPRPDPVANLPVAPARPTLRQIASEAPTNQLLAVLAEQIALRSDVDPALLRECAQRLDRHSDALERSRR